MWNLKKKQISEYQKYYQNIKNYKKYPKISKYQKYIKKKPTHRNREQTSAYQWGVEEGQYRGEEMGDTDYWL